MMQFCQLVARRRLWTMFVLALFAFDMLAPVFAALAGAPQRSHFTLVCAADGLKRVVPMDDPATQPGSNEIAFECPLCAASGSPAGMDARRAQGPLLALRTHEVPQVPVPALPGWSVAAPFARGPPSAA